MELENKLRNKVQKTKNDGIDRGIYINLKINKHPINDQKIVTDGTHLITITVQKQDDELFGTKLDSNLFFAVGKGRISCNKVAKKIAEMSDAYDATDILTYTNKKRS
ncbi:MAG: hypothetical protein KIT56_06040 [Gammaproteobacteria bacterium]|nr:hypothetical protein [Gammaproteobacteria bacterium]MCW5583430.1 hypothetical protein [Gammaproteobacteria bacterium]